MKKVLLALDPGDIDREAVEFACYISKLIRSRVTGVFLETNRVSIMPQPVVLNEQQDGRAEDDPLLTQSTSRFVDACVSRDSGYLLHEKQSITTRELLHESRFSDLLVLPQCLSPGDNVVTAPSSLVKHILSHSKCPVVLAPDVFNSVDEIVFTFNGSGSSIFAIKQFTYLFPELHNRKIVVLDVNAGNDFLEKNLSLTEWMESHYRNVEYVLSHGDPIDELVAYLLSHNNAFVVMGAYGRNTFSRMIRKSTADPLSGTLCNPIFISHK